MKLAGFEAAAKIKVIKEVRAITSLGLKEAKELVSFSSHQFISYLNCMLCHARRLGVVSWYAVLCALICQSDQSEKIAVCTWEHGHCDASSGIYCTPQDALNGIPGINRVTVHVHRLITGHGFFHPIHVLVAVWIASLTSPGRRPRAAGNHRGGCPSLAVSLARIVWTSKANMAFST